MVKDSNIFLGSGTSITKVPELDIYIPITETSGTLSTVTATPTFVSKFSFVKDLYIGCVLRIYSSANAFKTMHRVTGNSATTVSFTPSATIASGDYVVIDSYGAPCPAPKDSSTARLLADTWLGLTESITFPEVEVEIKPLNLSLGGSRNITYQYKGIETAQSASLDIVANQASWLYYFFGRCTNVDIGNVDASDAFSESAPTGAAPTGSSPDYTAVAGKTYIEYDAVTETGPIFRRTIGTSIIPFVNPAIEDQSAMHPITAPSLSSGKIQNAIEYTFAEQEGDLLPSFAMEQVFSKLTDSAGGSNIYRTETAETNESFNFVRIARGCKVNTLTLSANENEEVKINIDASTRAVHKLESDENYDARRGVTDETSFFNFSSVAEFREPFFFSDGTFSVFGQSFLKINTLSINMNNNLQERRFLGVGNKSVQEAIPTQRTYEITFTGHVTDNLLFNELLNQTENTGTSQLLELVFTKATGERITLKFKDYFVTSANFPLTEDKGPIVVEATVTPRNLHECKVRTHWLLQG